MLAWIPFIGPFIQAVVSIFTKVQDTKAALAQTEATKAVALGAQDVEIIKARAAVATAFKDDIGVKFARDVILNWYAIYISLIFYDSCFRNLLPSWMTWRTLALPASLEYLCAGIVAFLFVSAWRGK